MNKLFLLFALFISTTLVSCDLKVDVTFTPEECDKKSASGDKLSMHYTGSIDASSKTGTAGKVFDSSVSRGQPFDFTVGAGDKNNITIFSNNIIN